VTKAATSTLELDKVFYVIVRRIATFVAALRCSILTSTEASGTCTVLASSDNPAISGSGSSSRNTPKSCARSRPPSGRDHDVSTTRCCMGCGTARAARVPIDPGSAAGLRRRPSRDALPAGRAPAGSVHGVRDRLVPGGANASANALRNAMLFEEMRKEARRRKEPPTSCRTSWRTSRT